MEKKESRRKLRKILYRVLLGFFTAVFVFSAAYLIKYFVDSHRASQEYNDLANLLDQYRATMTTPAAPSDPPPAVTDPSGELPTDPTGTVPSEPTAPPAPTEPSILPEYAPFYQMNNDMVGWISMPGTTVNYPVMQTPDNPDYYLSRSFSKEPSDWGTIYARESCDIYRPSDNITLFGHYKKDGSMFNNLHKFRKQDYWQEHQTFSFDTLYEHHTYQIWAVFKISANVGSNHFPYHRFSDAATEGEFNEFVRNVKELQFFDTGITPVYGDKLLTLSTCEYTLENGRLVVCAMRVS